MTLPPSSGKRASLGLGEQAAELTDERVVSESLGRLVREASEAAEIQRRSSVAARRSDLAMRQRLGAAIAGGSTESATRSSGARRWYVAAAAAAVIALALLVSPPLRGWVSGGGAIGYEVAGATEVGGYVRAGDAPATVTFEDGSELVFAPGSAGRIGEPTAHGARVALEDGSVDVHIEKLPGADWALHAGPWEVRVIGTAFRLGWDARARSLRIDLREGKVSVRGPGAEEGVGLRAGQSLEAQEETGIRLTSAEAAPAAHAAAPAAPGAATPGIAAPGTSGAVATGSSDDPSSVAAPDGSRGLAAAPSAPRASWSARVAAGEFDAVLAEADERGVDGVLASASAADLVALGDAARYRGRSGVASRSLSALRDRFAGTPQAANAAFLLARMADDGGSAASAIRWYDVHMAEGGAFATEALGRKMLAVRRSGGDAAAAPVARQYLSRHPKGPHAPIARSLLGETEAAAPPGPNGSPTNGGRSPR